MEAMKGVEPLSSGLQDRRSCIQLSYIATNESGVRESGVMSPVYVAMTLDSRLATLNYFLVELRGVEPLRPACKAGIIPLDHSPE